MELPFLLLLLAPSGGPTLPALCHLLRGSSAGIPPLFLSNLLNHPTTNAALAPHPPLQIFFPPFSLLPTPSSVSSTPLIPLPLLTRSEFFSGTQEVFMLEVLNFFTFFRFFLLILSLIKNLIFTFLHLPEFLYTLLYDLIALTSSLTLLQRITYTLAVVPSSLSNSAYFFLNSQPPLSPRSTFTLSTLGSRFC